MDRGINNVVSVDFKERRVNDRGKNERVYARGVVKVIDHGQRRSYVVESDNGLLYDGTMVAYAMVNGLPLREISDEINPQSESFKYFTRGFQMDVLKFSRLDMMTWLVSKRAEAMARAKEDMHSLGCEKRREFDNFCRNKKRIEFMLE